MRTEDLITALAADTTPRGPALSRGLVWAVLGGGVIAGLVMQALLGVRANFVVSLHDPRFLFKFFATGLIAVVAFRLALRGMRPQPLGAVQGRLLLIPLLVLMGAVVLELILVPESLWLSRLMGRNWLVCLAVVPVISIGPLGLMLMALRRGAPASPAMAGFLAGMGAGALGAFFYAAHCPDDSPLFVAVWYVIAIGIVSVAGTLLGTRMLRW